MREFFLEIDRVDCTLAWEPRGKWNETPQGIAELCESCDLIHCVDPLRNQPLWFGNGRIAYFRLHGFGKPRMYIYDFSSQELRDLLAIVNDISVKVQTVYVFFNNMTCYRNAKEFEGIAKTVH